MFSVSTFCGRGNYSNFFAADANLPSTRFATSIWQTSQNDLMPPARNQAARNGNAFTCQSIERKLMKADHAYRNPRDLPSIQPRAKGASQVASNASERPSPITYQRNSSSSTEPLSAHSRSNNDSAVLTPNSNISLADQFPVQIHATQDPKQSRMINTQSYNVQSDAWTNAKEFRPKLSVVADRLPGPDGAHKTPAMDGSLFSGSRSADLNTIWTQPDFFEDYSSAQSFRNDFRPVLPAANNTYNSPFHSSQAYSDSRNADHSAYSRSNAPVSTNLEQYRAHYGTYNNQRHHPSANSAKTSSRSAVAGEQYDQSSTMLDNGHGRFCNKQTTNSRNFAGSCSQMMACSQPLYSTDYMPEEYYKKPPATFAYQPAMTARADHSLQAFQQYTHVYPEEAAGSGVQPFSSSSYHFGSALQDGRNTYYPDASMNLPLMSIDPMAERQAETQQIYRSPLLEEFRVNKNIKYELKDIYDHVVEFSGDQLGSRFIQQKLEVANSDEKDRVFNEVARDSRQLMTDVFGNYVIQKMFEHGNQSQKKLLASHMKGHVYALSLQTYGCRVVQKAFEHILTDQQGALIKELDGNVLKVVENQNGNHVIQKAIEMIPGEHIQFIVDAHQGHVHHLSKHPYGCRVIQRMLEYCQPQAKRQILDELHSNIADLIQDAFGNYVVQHVIVNGEPQDRKAVIDKVQSKLLENAMHKFASNVVEKALDNADEHQRRMMLHKLIGRDETGQSTATKLLTHQYGNYVIRKYKSTSSHANTNVTVEKSTFHLTGQNLATIIEEMEDYLSQLQRVSSGKQVSALQKSIVEARGRLNKQTYSVNHVPTHPRTSFVRR